MALHLVLMWVDTRLGVPMFFYAMSTLMTRRIDHLLEHRLLCFTRQGNPRGDHANLRCAVLSFAADSSTKTSCSAS